MAPHRFRIAASLLAFISAFIHPSWNCSGSLGSARPTSAQSGTALIWLDLNQYHALLSADTIVAIASSHVTIVLSTPIHFRRQRCPHLRNGVSDRRVLFLCHMASVGANVRSWALDYSMRMTGVDRLRTSRARKQALTVLLQHLH